MKCEMWDVRASTDSTEQATDSTDTAALPCALGGLKNPPRDARQQNTRPLLNLRPGRDDTAQKRDLMANPRTVLE